jgi:hypothetical protein
VELEEGVQYDSRHLRKGGEARLSWMGINALLYG